MDRRPTGSKLPPSFRSSSDETIKVPSKPVAQVTLEAIAHLVSSMSPEAMLRVLEQMREMIKDNGEVASRLLSENPQLAYALLQVLIVMRKVSPDEAFQMLHPQRPASLAAPFHYERPPSAAVRAPDVSKPPPSFSPASNLSQPPVVKHEPPASPHHPPPVMDEGEQTKILRQVLTLSEEQTRLLPPLEQAQVRELRRRFNQQ